MKASPILLQDRATHRGDFFIRYWDVIIWTAALTGVNWPLFTGAINTNLIFFTGAVGEGQWWRVLTYPLVHLSWYHLLLDGGAFLLLYQSLEEKRLVVRLAITAGAGTGSLALALALEPAIAHRGLCGLSGIAHGLMAVTGLEMMAGGKYRLSGLLSLGSVVSKSAWELWTGQVIFAGLHLGEYGTPLVASHGGGILGALLVYGAMGYIGVRGSFVYH